MCPGFTTVKPDVTPVVYGGVSVTVGRETVMPRCFPVLII